MRPKATLIMIDGSNLYATARMLNYQLDFDKVLTYFNQPVGTLLRALYFTALPPKNIESPLRKMIDHVQYNGYDLITKETKEYMQEDGTKKIKGNMDVEMTVLALKMAPFLSDIVLFTGDGDFKFLLEELQHTHGVRVTVVSSMATEPSMVSDELRRQADVFMDLQDLRNALERKEEKTVHRQSVFRRKQ